MSNYTKTVDFAAKDALPSGNPSKIAQGTEINTEFNNIATAIATKEDTANKNAASGYAGLNSSSQVTATLASATQVPSLDTSKITSGTFADARIAASNVTQHQASLSIAWSQITGTKNADQLNGLASSTAATGNTIAARNASGYLSAVYFNGSAAVEAVTIGAFAVENSGADGYFRKCSLTSAKRQLILNCTIQSDPGTTPSGTAGDVFFYY